MENELCWRCKEYINRTILPSDVGLGPFLHCHHEPKEKPKRCWCDDNYAILVEIDSGEAKHYLTATFCPQCGREMGTGWR